MIEYLTDEIERRASDYIKRIDEMGGALLAIENGFLQDEIQNAAYTAQRAVESGEQIVVGVNQFQVEEEKTLERLKVDPAIEQIQRQRLADLRTSREPIRVSELLAHLEFTARGTGNLVPIFIECVENKITLGEVCGTLRKVWGEYQPPVF